MSATQVDHDDVKSLKPHPDVDDDGHDERHGVIRSKLFDPQQLREYPVAQDQRPECPPVGTSGSTHGQVGEVFIRAS